ncbi:MotA/TolQ/ExbB proton channel family protein [Magnetospira sp. QH-2]|uniref:MotA/TolQ/ExbB proton channel family protein n=1 Tax=Magnetospira sp. (strain QH-2) TaxID=1288970 RepID=UPI0003E80C7B|nr:MotA/TolQ/ExbB proton channel family protein [Magnetospira sp. QH-2]CCQ72836.1 putative chemotaxis protein MotA (Flagellar motor component) [Magnetospira sp. QH-2]
MDLATIVGLVAGFALIVVAILLGGDLMSFVNVPSLMIVVGGTIASVLIRYTLKDVGVVLKTAMGIGFNMSKTDALDLVQKSLEMAELVRKNGLLALESLEIENDFFKRGIRLCTDGHNLDVIKETIDKEVNLTISRQEAGEAMLRGIGDSAPAFGMIGTLVGLVQMLSNMDDPKTIGPAMAIAMLTTFYGAVLANVFAIPLADKIAVKNDQDRKNHELIVQSIIQIHGNQSPMALKEILAVYLPLNKRAALADDDE